MAFSRLTPSSSETDDLPTGAVPGGVGALDGGVVPGEAVIVVGITLKAPVLDGSLVIEKLSDLRKASLKLALDLLEEVPEMS